MFVMLRAQLVKNVFLLLKISILWTNVWMNHHIGPIVSGEHCRSVIASLFRMTFRRLRGRFERCSSKDGNMLSISCQILENSLMAVLCAVMPKIMGHNSIVHLCLELFQVIRLLQQTQKLPTTLFSKIIRIFGDIGKLDKKWYTITEFFKASKGAHLHEIPPKQKTKKSLYSVWDESLLIKTLH